MYHFMSIFALICFYGVMTNGGITNNLVENVQYLNCDEMLNEIPIRDIEAPNPLKEKHIIGTWYSQSCETRPGPLHVLRSYQFLNRRKLNLSIHVYDDASCRKPIYSVQAQGHLSLTGSSLVTPGATEAEYSINEVHLTPYTNLATLKLIESLNQTMCSSTVLKTLRPNKQATVYKSFVPVNEVSGFPESNCVPSTIQSWNELQLLRVEIEESDSTWHEDSCKKKELFLGDLHTDYTKQKEYRPTAFQYPLLNKECMSECDVCKRLEVSSKPFRPPALSYRPLIRPPKLIEGTWASTRCEVQRYGLFLTRKLTFRPSRPKWHIKQRYFYDPHCKNATYTILASGNYKRVLSPEEILPGSFQGDAYDMTVRKMSIIPEDKIFAGQLNRLPGRACGIQGRWRKGKAQDVTLTGGCFPIGLKVPSVEPEILRFESGDKGKLFLTLGQTPTWPYKGKGMAPRPTSWGPKLQKCNDIPQTNEILKPIVGARVALNEGAHVEWGTKSCFLFPIFVIMFITKLHI